MFTKKTNNIFLLIIISLFTAQAKAQDVKSALSKEIETAHAKGTDFKDFSLFSITTGEKHDVLNDETLLLPIERKVLELYETRPEAISLTIDAANGRKYRLDMLRSNPFSDNPDIRYTDANGSHPFTADMGIHYQGAVAGSGKSLAALSVFSNGETMILFANEEGNFVVGKLEDASNTYILYNDRDFTVTPPTSCGTKEGDVALPDNDDQNGGDKTTAAFSCKKVRLYWEADYNLYVSKQSSTVFTQIYVTGLFNQVQTMYKNEQIAVELKSVNIWTTPDGYDSTDSHGALNDFTNAWNFKGNNFDGDLAMLLARDAGGNGGVAFLNALCNKNIAYAYGDVIGGFLSVPTYSWDVSMVTHEIGHNLGSNHTHWCGWNTGAGGSCGSIDNCVTQEWGSGCNTCPSTFSNSLPSWRGTVMSYCHLSSRGVDLANGFGPLPGNRIRAVVNNSLCLTSIISASLVAKPICKNQGAIDLVFDSVAVGPNHFGANPHTFTWSNGANTQNITVSTEGDYSVIITDSNGCSAMVEVTVTKNNADSCKSTSIEDTYTQNQYVSIYPNPAHNNVHVKFFSNTAETAEVRLTDITGKAVLNQHIKTTNGENNLVLNLSGITPGMYFINLTSTGIQYQRQKLVVQ